MKRDYGKTKDLFNQARAKGRIELVNNEVSLKGSESKGKRSNKQNEKQSVTNYELNYRRKLKEDKFKEFNTRDLLYYFKDKIKECGIKFITPNNQINRYLKNFKELITNESYGYSPEDVAIMIAFLFSEEQDYLNKRDLHPGILLTGWSNKIYNDSQLWVNDEYIGKKSKKICSDREWSGNTTNTKATIGEWDF